MMGAVLAQTSPLSWVALAASIVVFIVTVGDRRGR